MTKPVQLYTVGSDQLEALEDAHVKRGEASVELARLRLERDRLDEKIAACRAQWEEATNAIVTARSACQSMPVAEEAVNG